MPDMQTALKEALNEWDDSLGRHQVEKQQPTPLPEVAQMQEVTPDTQDYVPAVTQRHGDGLRNIFAYIKDYPNCSISDLKNAGFIEGTTASAIYRLYMAGKVTRTVVPNPLTVKKKIILRKKQAAPQAHGIAALPTKMVEVKTKEQEQREYIASRTPQPEPIKPKAVLTAAYVIDNISLSEAVLLHAELKKMLG